MFSRSSSKKYKDVEFIALIYEIESLPVPESEIRIIKLIHTFKDMWNEYQRILHKNKVPLEGTLLIEVLVFTTTYKEFLYSFKEIQWRRPDMNLRAIVFNEMITEKNKIPPDFQKKMDFILGIR